MFRLSLCRFEAKNADLCAKYMVRRECKTGIRNKSRDGRMWSTSILHVGTNQLDTSLSPNPSPNPNPKCLGGLEVGGDYRAPPPLVFGGVLPEKNGRPKGQPGTIRRTPVTKFVAYPSYI